MATCKYGCKNGKVFIEATSTFVDCPECRSIVKALEKERTSDGKTYYDILNVPDAYRGLGIVKRDVLTMFKHDMYTDASIEEVSRLLDNIVQSIYDFQKLPNISAYIYGGNTADMKMYVYSVQKLALENGLSVVPFVSANSLYGVQCVLDCNDRQQKLLKVLENGEKVNYENITDIAVVEGFKFCRDTTLTYYDFMTADLCFIEATSNTTEKGWVAVADILAERARRNLPTYVIGYWGTISQTSGNNYSGLRYLISESNFARLDRLTVYEVKSKKRNGQDTVAELGKNITVGLTRSSVVSGVNLKEFMKD